jgi:hypothetical protein
MSQVVKLKRKNNILVTSCDVYIGRAIHRGGWNIPTSKWANPFKTKDFNSREECLRCYEVYVRNNPVLYSSLYELEGKVLGCWCKPDPCHGDVLIKLLNEKQCKE